MAIVQVFSDSFDHYTSIGEDGLAGKWRRNYTIASPLVGSGHAIVGAGARHIQALYLPSGAGIKYNVATTLPNRPYFNFAVSRPSSAGRIIACAYDTNSNAINFTLLWRSDGKFELFDQAGVSQGTTVLAYPLLNNYYYLNLSADISASGQVDLSIDVNNGDPTTKTWSGVDLRGAGADSFISEFHFGSNGSATTGDDIYLDDIWLFYETGGYSSIVRGNVRVQYVPPSADGSVLDWQPSSGTTHYTQVDETPVNFADYVFTNSDSNTDLYTYPLPHVGSGGFGVFFNAVMLGAVDTHVAPTDRVEVIQFLHPSSVTIATIFNEGANLDPATATMYNAGIGTVGGTWTDYEWGPRLLRSAPATTADIIYQWGLEIPQPNFNDATTGWRLGVLAFN